MDDADRAVALIGQGRVIHDQHRTGAADKLLRPLGKHPLERLRRPAGGGYQMVHLLVLTRGDPRRERLGALALAGPDQATQVDRCPASPGRVPEDSQQRLKPALELTLPSSWSVLFHTGPAAGLGPHASGEVAKSW